MPEVNGDWKGKTEGGRGAEGREGERERKKAGAGMDRTLRSLETDKPIDCYWKRVGVKGRGGR